MSPLATRFASIFALCLCGFVSAPASAQISSGDRAQMTAAIKGAAESVEPARFPDLEKSQQRLLDELAATEKYFIAGTSKENAEQWLEYFDMGPVAEAIESEKSPVAVGREALKLSQRLVGILPGLELTQVRKLRDATNEYVSAVRFRDGKRSAELIKQQLESLAERIDDLDRIPTAEDAAELNAIVGLLEQSGQATEAIESFRHVFGGPNLAIHVGESVVQQVVARPVNETRPVDDCILGTRMIGTAQASGTIGANLLPAEGSIRLQVMAATQITSNNVGYNSPVTLNSISNGHAQVWRTINVSESGISLEPTQVQASLQSKITSINHRWRLVRRIARRRAAEQKPQAEQIALGKLRRQVADQFETQTREATAIEMPNLIGRLTPWLQRLSLAEPTRSLGSTDTAAFLNAALCSDGQLSSPVPKPVIRTSFDAAIQIHESLIDNLCSPVLAGRTLRETEVNEMLAEIGLPAPTASEPTADDESTEDPFEIDFARIQPIVFVAREQEIRIGVRGTRFSQGRRDLKQPMEITATYQPAKLADGSMVLLRDGEVNVDFPGRKRLSVSQAGLRGTIKKKFTKVFPEMLLQRPVEIPSTVTVESLRGKQYRPQIIDAREGWLTVTLR